MKKIYRAAYGDVSRIMIILADSLEEAITLANDRLEEEWNDDIFTFDKESVIEIPLNQPLSSIIEDIQE